MNKKLGKFTKVVGLTLILAMGAVISCNKDFLDTSNTDALSGGNFPTRIEDIELLVNEMYGRLRNGFFDAYPQARVGYGASHYADQAFSDNNFDAGAQVNFNPNSDDLREIWNKHYENITRANATLDAIQKFEAKGGLAPSVVQTLAYREGEVRFLRAWNYYYLINFFGESSVSQSGDAAKRGVPIVTTVATSLETSRVPRSTVEQVWNYIKSDLRKAQVLLNDKTWEGGDKARVSIWAVKGFLGKAHVFTQKWDSAKLILKDVIDNSGKSLVSYAVYRDMFNNTNQFNSESIFELNFNDKQVNTDWSNASNASTYFPILISPSFIAVDDTGKENQDCNGFCNFIVHDKSMLRFGWTDTTKNTYNRPAYITLSKQIRQGNTVDPRFWASVQQPRLDSINIGNKPVAIGKNKGEGVQAVIKSLYGWSFRKLTLTSRGLWTGPGNQIAMNMYWLRLADVYLLYAEACQNTSDNANALEYLNKVKRRAYNLPINSPSAIDYATLSSTTMASVGDPLRNDPLKYERWAELFGEHASWWFDICRWKIGQQEFTYYGKVATGTLQWNDNKYAMPIPQNQINAFDIGQNPGY
jgi:starch-binding outer membrane protein, SusD/RagB family